MYMYLYTTVTYVYVYNVLCTCTCMYMNVLLYVHDCSMYCHIQQTCTCIYIYIYMLGAKHGFAQSVDCSARNVDLRFARRSMDCPLNLRTAQFTVYKVQICERSMT